jgi:hypothetical protein
MTMRCSHDSWYRLARIATVIVSSMCVVAPLSGQTDLQVMVSGPWDYVQDPHDAKRVVVIVPISNVHDAATLFSGDDATKFNGKRRLEPGIFKLDINNRVYSSKISSTNPYRLQETTNIAVDIKGVVEPTIYGPSIPRYAISLPKPDYYTTYSGAYGNGTSQSIVSNQPIINSGGATDYTTWMVLHYAVSGVAAAKLTGTSDDGSVTHNDDIQFVSSTGGSTLGISIVSMAKDNLGYWMCDSYSYDSFTHTKLLWGGLLLYALFPSVDSMGVQTRGDFHYNCSQVMTKGFLEARLKYRETLDEIQLIREYLESPTESRREQTLRDFSSVKDALNALFNEVLPEDIGRDFDVVNRQLDAVGRNPGKATDSQAEQALTQIAKAVRPFTAGGGDCHEAQLSINRAIP